MGTQTLEVVRKLNSTLEDKIQITALSAGTNVSLLAKQATEFGVRYLCVSTKECAEKLSVELSNLKPGYDPTVFIGEEGLVSLAEINTELIVTAIVGMRGLRPTLAAIEKGTDIALANKETLVTGGGIVMRKAAEKHIRLLPVDSEHSAIFQCLRGQKKEDVSRLILTASGGPFRGYSKEQLENVTLKMALGHPTWKMGKKITVDCATLMNKGLEVIEASVLFGFSPDDISVVIHPQSIIHSMVEFKDGSVKAQLSVPDMKLPIMQAVNYPENSESAVERLDFTKISPLTFEKPDTKVFRCLKLAYDALREGGTAPAILNGANEAAVALFLREMIKFTDIATLVDGALSSIRSLNDPSVEDILEADRRAREYVGAGRI